ncbi:MAG: 50S ribosomal protein L2 [Patescibacteria group bacterium]|nr:50S ribosomal protein L2 [Patescibacteria group bacterium]
MPIKLYKPTTAGRRKATVLERKILTRKEPEKSLISGKKSKAGRSKGKITVRHRGGGAKKLYRQIDFYQDKFEIKGKIKSIEYDPNRSALIALVVYPDGEKRYILAQEGLKVGDEVLTSRSKIEQKIGYRMPLKFIPTGTIVSNIELFKGQGGQLARAAGSYATVMGSENGYTQIKLPSGEIRKVSEECLASIGQMSNIDHWLIRLGKAGRKRHLGIRPSVRGKAMSPRDHPHGGGEGHTPIGLKHPKTPWGKPALGVKTRKKKQSDKFIVKRRK